MAHGLKSGLLTLQVSSLESEIGLEACRFLSNAAVNKRLVAIVEVLFVYFSCRSKLDTEHKC